MMSDRIRFMLAAPFFITGFFLIFASVAIMAGFLTACAALYRVNQLLGPDDAPFLPPRLKEKKCQAPSTK